MLQVVDALGQTQMSEESIVIEAARTSARLVPLRPFEQLPAISLNRPLTLIGSGSMVHVRLRSQTISRIHALCLNTDGRVYIHDLASRSGLMVNGRRIRHALLRQDDRITIGKIEMRFQDAPGPSQGAHNPSIASAQLCISADDRPIPLAQPAFLIGRRESADLALPDDSVSVAHAILFRIQGRWLLRDLGSRTGTFLNDQRIQQAELVENDSIRVGQTRVRFQIQQTRDDQAPAPLPAVSPEPLAQDEHPATATAALPAIDFESIEPIEQTIIGSESDSDLPDEDSGAPVIEAAPPPAEPDHPSSQPADTPFPSAAFDAGASDSLTSDAADDSSTDLQPPMPVDAAPPEVATAHDAIAAMRIDPPPAVQQPQPQDLIDPLPPAQTTPPIPAQSSATAHEVAAGPAKASPVAVDAAAHQQPPAQDQPPNAIDRWGPLALAVASELYPQMVPPIPAAPTPQPPPRKRHLRVTVLIAMVVVLAAAAAAWFFYPQLTQFLTQ